MRWLIPVLTVFFALSLVTACGDDTGTSTPNDWKVGENQSEPDCKDDSFYDASLEDCPIPCPLAEGYSYFEDDCGCACLFDDPDPPPPISCPDESDGYHYMADNRDDCAAIDFMCDSRQEPFYNECGCGCRDLEPPSLGCDEEDGFFYDYHSYDVEECDLIWVSCPDVEGTYHFENNCGCGCKEAIGFPPGPVDPQCEAMDARGEGYCRAEFGYAYDGRSCRWIHGCECVGEDCDALFETRQQCLEAYDDDCLQRACEPMDVSGEGYCDAILGFGYFGENGGCMMIGGCDCIGDDCDLLYMDPMDCEEDHRHCADTGGGNGGTDPDPICSPWDVELVGPCDEELGFGYDGEQCRSFSGCSCNGSACTRLTGEQEECEEMVQHCP